MIKLLSSPDEVLAYVNDIVTASNEERKAFGFLPNSVYRDFAFDRRLIVAIEPKSKHLAGYVIFTGSPPTAKIRQTYVKPEFRQRGVGQLLVGEAVRRCESLAYLSIRANVAQDLTVANAFYDRMGFVEVARKGGGRTTGRTIITRVRELNTPSLFDVDIDSETLGQLIKFPESKSPPLYLFDVNVLLDVARQRKRHGAAMKVLSAAFDGNIKLAVSQEFITELSRSAATRTEDPLLELARALPVVVPPSDFGMDRCVEELSLIVFPDRAAAGRLSPQDRSDLRHLATAIAVGAAAFITSEKAILRSSPSMQVRHGLEIISPETFFAVSQDDLSQSDTTRYSINERSFVTCEMASSDEESFRKLLDHQGVPNNVCQRALQRGTSTAPRSRFIVRTDEKLVAAATWAFPNQASASARIYLFADYQDGGVEAAVDHLIELALNKLSAFRPTAVYLRVSTKDALLRERAMGAGFHPSPEHRGEIQFSKLCVGMPITRTNWGEIIRTLASAFDLRLPSAPPNRNRDGERILITSHKANRRYIELRALEDFLAPTLMAFGDRESVIVPIQPHYAEGLFRGSLQPNFLAGRSGMILPQKVYLSASTTVRRIPENGIIVFYESAGAGRSKGRSAAIAVARIQTRYLASERAAKALAAVKGVITDAEIEKMAGGKSVCVTEFDHLMLFKKAVPLDKLQNIGCADGANLITAKPLTPSVLEAVIALGEPHAAATR